MQVYPSSRPSFANLTTRLFVFIAILTVYSVLILFHGQPWRDIGRENKRRLVWHAGPGKMGTTFLQEILMRKALSDPLRLDEFVYIGHYTRASETTRVGPDFFRPTGRFTPFVKKTTRLRPAFRKLMYQLRDWNVMIVAEGTEGLTQDQLNVLGDFLGEWWTVETVVSYRPYYDWLPSRWNQQVKPKALLRSSWPSQQDGQGVVPSIQLGEIMQQFPVLPTGRLIERVTAGLWTTPTVMDLSRLPKTNGTDPMLTYFLCSVAKLAHSCEALVSGRMQLKPPYANPSYPVAYDAIAVEARKRNYLSKLDRAQAIEVVRVFQEERLGKSVSVLPYKCPSSTALEDLLNRTLKFEETLFGPLSLERIQEHRQTIVKKMVLCNVDVDKVLSDSGWMAYLQRESK